MNAGRRVAELLADDRISVERRIDLYREAKEFELDLPTVPRRRPDPGAFLKAKREQLGRSQRSVAKASGVSSQALSDLERGDVEMRLSTFSKIATELGIGLDEVRHAGLL